MSLLNDKIKIFDTLKIFSSYQDVPKLKDNYNLDSLKSNINDSTTFLLDLVIVLVGQVGLKEILAKIVTAINNTFEAKLKLVLQKLLITFSSNKNLGFIANKSFTIPVGQIDIFNSLRDRFTNNVDKKIIDSLNDTFYRTLFNAIDNPNTDQSFVNLFTMKFSNNNLTIKFHDSLTQLNTSQFIQIFINSFNLVNVIKIVAEIIDAIFGTLTRRRKKSVKDIETELFVEQFIESIENDTVFQFRINDNQIKARQKGFSTVNFGCSNDNLELDIEELDSALDDISNNVTNETVVANTFERLSKQSFDDPEGNDDNYKTNFYKGLLKKILMIVVKNVIFSIPFLLLLLILFIIKKGININNISPNINNLNPLTQLTNVVGCLGNQNNKYIQLLNQYNNLRNNVNQLRTFLAPGGNFYGNTIATNVNKGINDTNVVVNELNSDINLVNNGNVTDAICERLKKNIELILSFVKYIGKLINIIFNFDFRNLTRNKIICLINELRPLINEIIFKYIRGKLLKLAKPVLEKIAKELIDNYIKTYLSLVKPTV